MSLNHLYRGSDLGRLKAWEAAPPSLWVRGDAGCLDAGEAIAVVGARAASGRGLRAAGELAAGLVERGAVVVSGGALGVDAAAHEATLAAGGRTVAVLGTGVDVVYPRRHAALFARIIQEGALVSAFPPGTEPRPGQFPARNSVIAALADGVVVVEAARQSGSLYTAAAARRLGRRVWALQGSGGCDELIAAGHAELLRAPADLMAILDGGAAALPPAPAGDAARVWAVLDCEPLDAGWVARAAQLSVPDCLAALGDLELAGWAIRSAGGRWRSLATERQ